MELRTRLEFKRILEQKLSPQRLRHSLLVERTAVRLAAMHDVDWYRAGLAGLVHDICKEDSLEWQYSYLRRHGIRLDKEWLSNPQLWHTLSGSLYLRQELGLRDRQILSAVRWHTTGRSGMSPLEKVICLADAVSEDREFEGVEVLRQVALEDLDQAMSLYLAGTVKRVAEKGKPLVRQSWEAYNEYALGH